jgi:hypothetical protein
MFLAIFAEFRSSSGASLASSIIFRRGDILFGGRSCCFSV